MNKFKKNIDIIFFSTILPLLALSIIFNNLHYSHPLFMLLFFGSIVFMLPQKNVKDERLIVLKGRAAFFTLIFTITMFFIGFIFASHMEISLDGIDVHMSLRYIIMSIITMFSITYIVLQRIY